MKRVVREYDSRTTLVTGRVALTLPGTASSISPSGACPCFWDHCSPAELEGVAAEELETP